MPVTNFICSDENLRYVYFEIITRLSDVVQQIKRHEKEFPTIQIKDNPVASIIQLHKLAFDKLERQLPESCFKIKHQITDLNSRLLQFRDCIGTALCKNPHNTYDWLAENIISPILKEIQRDITDPQLRSELMKPFFELFAKLREHSARTTPQQIQKEYLDVPKPPRRRVA